MTASHVAALLDQAEELVVTVAAVRKAQRLDDEERERLRAENVRLERAVAINHDGAEYAEELIRRRDKTIAELGTFNAQLIAAAEEVIQATGSVVEMPEITGDLSRQLVETVGQLRGDWLWRGNRIAELEAELRKARESAEEQRIAAGVFVDGMKRRQAELEMLRPVVRLAKEWRKGFPAAAPYGFADPGDTALIVAVDSLPAKSTKEVA